MSKPASFAVQWISGVLCLRDAYWLWPESPIVHIGPEIKLRAHRLALHLKRFPVPFLISAMSAGLP